MKLIIGLGNPGKEYQKTRHNVGYMVLDKFISSIKYQVSSIKIKFETNQRFNSMVCKPSHNLIVVKPLTFMNLSGEAVAKLANFYKVPAENIIVIHDDVDLELGRLKIQKGGGAAGHHGIESIVKSLKTEEFIRFRVGTGRPEMNHESRIMNYGRSGFIDYVLEKFSKKELEVIEKAIEKTTEAVEYFLENGLEKAMNKFN